MAELDWLVVRDLQEIEKRLLLVRRARDFSGELRTEEIPTEVFFLPAAAHTEKEGSFTNTQRLLQWHLKAVEAPADCRSELWFMYHLGRRIREKLAGSRDPKDRPVLDLTWSYPTAGPHDEPDAQAVLREINGFDSRGVALSSSNELATTAPRHAVAGSTAAATRTGSTRPRGAGPDRSRVGSRRSGAGPGLRTGAFCTTAPPPIPRAGRGPNASATSGGMRSPRAGRARMYPTSSWTCRPTTSPPPERERRRRWTEMPPSSCRPTVGAGSSCRGGSSTDRCRHTTSHTSHRSTTCSMAAVEPGAAASYRRRDNRTIPPGAKPGRCLSVRDDHLPADRAPHGRRHVALARHS